MEQATEVPTHRLPYNVVELTKEGPNVRYAGESEATAREVYSGLEHAIIQHRQAIGDAGSQMLWSEHK